MLMSWCTCGLQFVMFGIARRFLKLLVKVLVRTDIGDEAKLD